MTVIQIPIPSCEAIPELPDPMQITLPGGATISQVISAAKSAPNAVDMGLNLMQQAQPALAPLMPIFDIIEAMQALSKCTQAIPDALGPPPDPTVFAKCLPDMAKKVAKLLKLIPQLSVPLMVKDIIDVVISTLVAVRSQLLALQAQMKSVTRATKRAAELNDKDLSAIAACAQGNVQQQAKNIGASIAVMAPMIGVVNDFLKKIGAPQIPLSKVSDLSGQSLDTILVPLDALVTTLKTVRQAVPVP